MSLCPICGAPEPHLVHATDWRGDLRKLKPCPPVPRDHWSWWGCTQYALRKLANDGDIVYPRLRGYLVEKYGMTAEEINEGIAAIQDADIQRILDAPSVPLVDTEEEVLTV